MLRFSKDYTAAGYTMVDNLFFSEYLGVSTDKQVKVYLYGLYVLHTGNEGLNRLEKMSAQLSLSEKEIMDAYEYWEESGLVEVVSVSPPDIRYVPLSGVYGKPRKLRPGKYADFTKQVQMLLPDRMITPNEFNEYFNLIEFRNIEPEALVMCIKYCTMVKGNTVNYRYIITVANSWADRMITTLSAAEQELVNYNKNAEEIREVLKALGQRSGTAADYADTELYVKWREKYGFELTAVVHAAKTLRMQKGTMQKLDALLTMLYKYKKFSVKEIDDILGERQYYRDAALSVAKALGEYVNSIDNAVETFIVPWSDMGYTPETLVALATYCFKAGIRTLAAMNGMVEKMSKMGLISLENIEAYIMQQQAAEQTVRAILEAAGLDRPVSTFDRTNYNQWNVLWGIPDDVILYAAAKVADTFNPLRNLHSLLSHYRFNNVRTVEAAKALPEPSAVAKPAAAASGEPKYQQHDYTKEELAAVFDAVDKFKI